MVDLNFDSEVSANIADGIDNGDQNTMQLIQELMGDLELEDVGQAVQVVANTMSPEAIAAMNRAAATAAYYDQQASIAAQKPSFSEFEIQQAAARAQAAAETQAAIVAAASQAAAARAAAERSAREQWIADQQSSAQAAAQAQAQAREQFIAEQQSSAQAAAQAQAQAQRPAQIASALDAHVKQLRALGYNVIIKVS